MATPDPRQTVAPPAAYPYADRVLRPAWSSRRAQRLAAVAVIGCLVAIVWRFPVSPAEVDDIALRIILPSTLAFVLAFAPPPATVVSRTVRDLTIIALVASVFAGNFALVMLLCYPLLLAAAVAMGSTRLAARIWGSAT